MMMGLFKTKNAADEKRVRPLRRFWGKKLSRARKSDNHQVFAIGVSAGISFSCILFLVWIALSQPK